MPDRHYYACADCTYTEQVPYMMSHVDVMAGRQYIQRNCPHCGGRIEYVGCSQDTNPL